MKLRQAKPSDIHDIIRLCADHAKFEKAAYDSEGKAEKLKDGLFSKNPKLYCLVVIAGTKVVGYTTFMKQYSTWDADEYIYMDCLYLDEACRGHGMGEKLIDAIRDYGDKEGLKLIQWQTPAFNVRAIKFYKRLGATSKSKERFYLTW